MVNFCPYCGNKITFSAKFCPECGYDLQQMSKKEIKQEQTKNSVNIYELGEKFEQVVENIFQAKGYITTRRKRLRGKSGSINEIDVLAEKGGQTIAVECKNLSSDIGQEHIRNFWAKLNELNIRKGYFATYSDYTSGARLYAQPRNITLWNRENVMESFLALSIGRFEQGHRIQLKNALPLNLDYHVATKVNLKNVKDIEVRDHPELIYHPYYSIAYSFKATYRDPTKKSHKFSDNGTLFLDAIDGRVLNYKGFTSKVISKIRMPFTKGDEKPRTKLLNELSRYQKATNYDVSVTNDFHVNKMEPEIPSRFATKLAVDFISDKNSKNITYRPKSSKSMLDTIKVVKFIPQKNQIMIKKTSFFYVPKWSITFASKDIEYSRQLFAFSGTVVEDTIAYCPEHFEIGGLKFHTKNSVAVCEICGQALCEDHVKQCPVCGKWLCYDHGVECEGCRNLFCLEHISHTCAICSKPLCDTCTTQCPICNRLYSRTHEVMCEKCERFVCSSCIVTEGFLRKKHYCKNCHDLIYLAS
jgi:hypothetical protein